MQPGWGVGSRPVMICLAGLQLAVDRQQSGAWASANARAGSEAAGSVKPGSAINGC